MAFRFQKRIKIVPGVKLNISKSGISTSIGTNGATVNLSKRGVERTVGIPGTGLSHRKRLGGRKRKGAADDAPETPSIGLLDWAIIVGVLTGIAAILWWLIS